jgi:TetR/AcrR family transcriptional regulator, cholesterol catabolism regulator
MIQGAPAEQTPSDGADIFDDSLASEARSGAAHRDRTRFDERRQQIVDIAAELFAANGYSATGIREIGEAASVARGALYYYIESKESLLSEIHDRVLDPLLEVTANIAARDETATARIRQVSEVLVRQVIERHEHVWVFLHEYRSLTGERRAEFRRKRAQFEGRLMALLASGVERGEFDVADLSTTMLAFLGMHNYTNQWARMTEPLDPAAVSRLYCDIFLRGILRPPDGPDVR